MVVWLVVAMKVLGLSELSAIGSDLMVLGIYYVLLGMNRKKLNRRFMFYIAKT